MKKRAKLMLIGSGVTAVMVALAESARHGVADYFVGVALNREIPPHPMGAERLLVVRCADSEMLEQVAQTGKVFASRPHKIVEICAQDGTRLVGHWMGLENPKRVIIAMHGWRSVWHRDFGMIADFFAENGCSVLYAEQRGQGESGGDYMGFGLTERYDCLEWIRWANENGFADVPIYLCGVSMGAATVMMTAGLQLPENVHGVIADCGFTSPHDIWKHVVENNLHMSFGGINAAIANDMCKKKIRMGTKEYSSIEAMKSCKVPVLFIHGTDDRFVPIEMTYENYKACASPKRLFVVPGAEHAMSYLIDKEGYENSVKAFWKDFDTYTAKATENEENQTEV